MNYTIYKLVFPAGVHLGQGILESSGIGLMADTIFSALCHEVLSSGQEVLNELIDAVRESRLLLSDAFPYREDEYYLPKPYIRIESKEQPEDVSKRKLYKKLKYVPVSLFSQYAAGKYDPEKNPTPDFAKIETKVSASIRGEEETVPYRVGITRFFNGCGLYMIAAYESDKELSLLEKLITELSYSGIGGKRSTGLGRFELKRANLPVELVKRLTGAYARYMTISIGVPEEEEMNKVIEEADYMLMKRSGFVQSETYASEFRRKRDFYVFQSGSCFSVKFDGQLADVSNGGTHPVYRYAKPIFLGVL